MNFCLRNRKITKSKMIKLNSIIDGKHILFIYIYKISENVNVSRNKKRVIHIFKNISTYSKYTFLFNKIPE